MANVKPLAFFLSPKNTGAPSIPNIMHIKRQSGLNERSKKCRVGGDIIAICNSQKFYDVEET